MTEKTVTDADRTMVGSDGHRRFRESVDTTKTPDEERKDPKRQLQGVPEAKPFQPS